MSQSGHQWHGGRLMWGKARTIFLVTLVTVLIWIWADAETQKDDLLRPIAGTASVLDEVEMTVETLPVFIAMPAAGGKAQWERAHLETTDLKRVTITGPRAVIERIRAGDATVRPSALLVLDDQDWQSGSVSKGAEIVPGGLGLRFVGPAPTLRATIAH